jgi:phytoene dehydrogenase-like protein
MKLRALGKSVVVVEKDEILGGHTRTWTDPSNGISVDYGLQAYGNSTCLESVLSG